MHDFADFLTNQGFAVTVALYLLIRMEPKINRLIKDIEELNQKVSKFCKKE
jgi:hypothetical protein